MSKEGDAPSKNIMDYFGGPHLIVEAVGTEASVIKDIANRQAMGIKKYGTTVANNPLELKEWLQHAYEEALDQAVYLKRAIEEMEK